MRFIYPAILRPLEDGYYEAKMPDLEGCTARGFSIDDCMEELNAAALEWIRIELEEGGTLPPVSDHEDLADTLKEGELLRNVCLTYRASDGWEE